MTKKTFNSRNLDVRIVQRKIAKGIIDAKEYNNYVDALPDLVDECEVLDLSDDSDEPTNGESAMPAELSVVAPTLLEA
jgi:hypothetical protein